MITTILFWEKNGLLGKRILAFAFDLLLVGLMSVVIPMLSPQPIPTQLMRWVFIIVFLTYSILFDYYQHGTPGKHLMRIRISYTYEKRSYLLTTFYRDFLKLFCFLEALWLFGAPCRQGFHNGVARCIIVEDVATHVHDSPIP
jgi:uncharacterized RDD family membrane protein YckC